MDNTPLTKEQKQQIAILARMAFKGANKEFTAWRHAVAIEACGKRITAATQADFENLKNAFSLPQSIDCGEFQLEWNKTQERFIAVVNFQPFKAVAVDREDWEDENEEDLDRLEESAPLYGGGW